MTYVKLITLALFLVTTLLMFQTKNVEAEFCSSVGSFCSPFNTNPCGYLGNCRCVPYYLYGGTCENPFGFEHNMKMIEEHPNLCQTHAECIKKGSGNFCARYANADVEYGWCFASVAEAERYFKIGSNTAVKSLFKIASKSKEQDYLKMALEIAT
ncbi:putative albumin I [Medicago truncatula]|uniref:Leginsulin related MtN11/16/17 family n=1 Tax=Medicago truncatula TaxID=3880 RepID=I3T793_MEDTR|nr:albumin-1 [Medicago truncatula]AFK48385.1 unknown [Medicago truncatula]KEH33346.1 leginsulin related MtN11/16/17 family [Medicago truncatula]RHN66407.1 putative albumin I [Medicago truncatula]